MKRSTQMTFRSASDGKRVAAAWRKQMGIGVDGLPRRYGPRKKAPKLPRPGAEEKT